MHSNASCWSLFAHSTACWFYDVCLRFYSLRAPVLMPHTSFKLSIVHSSFEIWYTPAAAVQCSVHCYVSDPTAHLVCDNLAPVCCHWLMLPPDAISWLRLSLSSPNMRLFEYLFTPTHSPGTETAWRPEAAAPNARARLYNCSLHSYKTSVTFTSEQSCCLKHVQTLDCRIALLSLITTVVAKR